jgi:two-component system, NarL family, response regulator NreC
MINIVLADDHQVLRKGLKALLTTEPDFKIIGEAGDGLETVKLVEQLHSDILILDLMLTGINGLEVTRQLSKKCPETNIIILTMHSNEAYVLEALRLGAKAYILKEANPEELIHAIREVMAGRRYLSSILSERAIDFYAKNTEIKQVSPYSLLTTREREILQLTAQGMSNAEISAHLFISPRTVETHRTNMMHKLKLHNNAQVMQFAIQNKVVDGNLLQSLH